MKKFCYFLSIAGHALLIIIALNADFPIVFMPQQERVIAIEVSSPPPRFFAPSPLTEPLGIGRAQAVMPGGAGGENIAATPANGTGGTAGKGDYGSPFMAPVKFSLKEPLAGMFSLSPTSKGPGLPAGLAGPGGSSRMGKYSASAFNPGTMAGGAAIPGGVTLVPFNIREKAVAAWTEAVLARIERNWIIPVSARLAFSGQVQITLTIEKNGTQRALVMDDSSLPEAIAQSARQAVNASLPLPPLPANIAGTIFAFTFIFDYNG